MISESQTKMKSSSSQPTNMQTPGDRTRMRIQIFLVCNLVVTFCLIIGQLLLLGSIQQVYNRMIAIQADYSEYYLTIRENIEAAKAIERGDIPRPKESSK